MERSRPATWSTNDELRVHFALREMDSACRYVGKLTAGESVRDTEYAERVHAAMNLARYYERLAELDPDDPELRREAADWQVFAEELLADELPDELR